jgi:endonuclease/exonuclease/phosphatase family metal-dependent hydrolase
MKEQLNGFDYFGVGRDDGKEKGEYTAIFYDTDALKLIQQQTFWLSTTPDKPSKAWDAALPRVCTWAELEVKSSGQRFYVFNTHFDHVGVEARKQSVSLILEVIKRQAGNAPVVLMGDFNFEPDKAPYAVATSMLRDSRKISASKPYGPEATFNGFGFDKRPERRIDYIFVNDQLRTLNYATLSDSRDMRYPSDHFPVIVTLQFEQ